MAAALPWIGTALAAGGAVMQANAASNARQAARENAKRAQAEAAEEARRLSLQQKETEARTRAAIAASGTGMGSESQLSYLDKMKREHEKELAWVMKAGSMRARSETTSGKLAYKQGMAGAIGSFAGAAGSAYNYFGPRSGGG